MLQKRVLLNGLPVQLAEDGYAVVRRVFEPDELNGLRGKLQDHVRRNGVNRHGGKSQPNAAIEMPTLAPIFCHPNVVKIYQEIFPNEPVMFTSHCDVHYNTVSGWHDDTGSEGPEDYFRGASSDDDSPQVYKMAIYLQDHTGGVGGLSVLPGSHRDPHAKSQPVRVDTKLGDVVVFDVRTLHAGQLPSIVDRAIRKFCRPMGDKGNELYSRFRLATLVKQTSRTGIFFSFGKDDPYTHMFARRNMRKALDLTGGTRSHLADDLRESLKREGLALLEEKNAGEAAAESWLGAHSVP